jgi:hypothetical protein
VRKALADVDADETKFTKLLKVRSVPKGTAAQGTDRRW